MNIDFKAIDSSWGLKLEKTPWTQQDIEKVNTFTPNDTDYAYVFEWHHFLAPKLLNQLQTKSINAKVATGTFVSQVNGQNRTFASGSILIPASAQTIEGWRETLFDLANKSNIELVTINTGLTKQGIDFGSDSFRKLKQPKALLLGGQGISQYEAGEIRYYLDGILKIPLSIVEHSRLTKVDLSYYSHLILVDGDYNLLSESHIRQVKTWLKHGGVIYAQKRAAIWLAKQDILSADIISNKQIAQLFDSEQLKYQDKAKLNARKRIAGAIFATTLDTSHPLAFGYTDKALPLFRNSTLVMDSSRQPFTTVAKYVAKPLLSGYTDKNLVNLLAHNSAIVAHNYGKGRVIASADVLAFRGYWFGSAKLIANSLFFAKAFNTPVR